MAGHRTARCFNLPGRDALGLKRFQAELPKIQREPAFSGAVYAAFEGLAEFGAFGLQHDVELSNLGVTRRRAARGAALALAMVISASSLFSLALVLSHRIMLEDFALEDPNLDAAGAIGRMGRSDAIINVGAQRMQRHTALAIPFEASDFRAAKATRTIDPNSLGAESYRRLHGPLHRPTKRDAPLELLSDQIGDERRFNLRLANLDNIDDDFAARSRPTSFGSCRYPHPSCR